MGLDGDWHEDCYLDAPFGRVAAEAMDMREAQGDEEVAAMYASGHGPDHQDPRDGPPPARRHRAHAPLASSS